LLKLESRAIAVGTARCSCKFRYVSNVATASYVRFPCHNAAFLLKKTYLKFTERETERRHTVA